MVVTAYSEQSVADSESDQCQCDRPPAYQKALSDFGIADLIDKLSNFCDRESDARTMHLEQQELENLAATVIRQLNASLKGSLIANYLNIFTNADLKIVSDLPGFELVSLQIPTSLPADFPLHTAAPLFRDGDLVRWIPLSDEIETHKGAVIGRFFAYAQHQGQWAWKYLVWLGDSTSRVAADTAWEEDLQLLAQGE